MSGLSRKFVAVLLMLWLPLFSAAALAESLVMKIPASPCHEMMDMEAMDHAVMEHMPASASGEDHAAPCNDCGICHLACSAYIAVPDVLSAPLSVASYERPPYRVSFRSITFAPLLPPPLARA